MQRLCLGKSGFTIGGGECAPKDASFLQLCTSGKAAASIFSSRQPASVKAVAPMIAMATRFDRFVMMICFLLWFGDWATMLTGIWRNVMGFET